MRNPVSRNALHGLAPGVALARISELEGESIYDGPSRLAQPDEAWNFGRGDGLEKCLLAANVLGGSEILVDDGRATLVDANRAVCSFPTAKSPRDRRWELPQQGH